MKTIFTKIFKKIIPLYFLLLPLSSFAQGNYNVTFAGTPNATFEFNGGNGDISAFVSGSLNLENMGNIGIGNVKVVVKFSETMIPLNYNGSFDVTFQGALDPMETDFVGGGNFGAQVGSVDFNPGQTYYILFKVMPSNMVANFPGDAEIITVTAPGTNNNGGNIDPPDNTGGDITPPNNTGGDITPPEGSINLATYSFNTINNPLGQDFNILEFLQKLFANLVKIAIPILVVFLVYSGFRFVEAQGNEEKLKSAKQNFMYVVIGGLLIFGAWTIAMVLKGTVDQLEQPISFIIYKIINLV